MNEAEAMAGAFARRGAPVGELCAAYERALVALEIPNDPVVDRLVAGGADLNAAEMVLRRRDPENGLTRRARVMLTLLEAGQDLPGRGAGWAALLAAPFAGAWHWIAGSAALWRHGCRG
ncbi:MAG: hypothetical protein FJW30_14905 [Acidobacteria bacterium]|nr:hypothetical protein [Acidobacteriota bacterium]